MIKFTYLNTKGQTCLGLGISEENVKRIKLGKPIYVDCSEIGIKVDGAISIYYGETEQILYDTMKEFIGPETKFNVDEKLNLKK